MFHKITAQNLRNPVDVKPSVPMSAPVTEQLRLDRGHQNHSFASWRLGTLVANEEAIDLPGRVALAERCERMPPISPPLNVAFAKIALLGT